MASILPASRPVRLTLAGLVAALVLALTFASGVASAGFFSPGDNSPEAGFARDMSLHHAQAVEMGMLAYRKAANDEVRNEGYDIALTQQAQIGVMSGWLDKWHDSQASSEPAMSWMPGGARELTPEGLMPGMASDAEMTKLNTVTGKDFDVLFCQLMIQHHLGGIHMARAVLSLSSNADVRTLAQSMVDGQNKEITIFEGLLRQMGAKPLS
jgi:uncharacterized protein (DUF305 family)